LSAPVSTHVLIEALSIASVSAVSYVSTNLDNLVILSGYGAKPGYRPFFVKLTLIEHVPDQDVESILNDLAAEPAWRSVRSEFIWRFVIESAFSTLEGESKALTPSSLASCVSIRVRGGDKEMTGVRFGAICRGPKPCERGETAYAE
jgi:hypothetical protein